MTAWANSRRRDTLPPGWKKLRATILRRDNHTCQLHYPGCTIVATEVDHAGQPTDHRPEMLRSVCSPCHKRRTAAQAATARATQRQLAKHPTQQHPALRRGNPQ